jgi:hypothetical protein
MTNRVVQHIRSNAVAYIALFVALGGTSYAAIKLPANSVGTRQIKNHSITPIKLDPRQTGAVVRFWAVLDSSLSGSTSGEQVTASRPRARITTWDSAFDSGTVSWGRPIPSSCFPTATAANGFASARLIPGAKTHASVLVSPYTPGGQHTTGLVYLVVLCPQP